MKIEHKNRIEIDLENIDPENGLVLRMEKPFGFFFNEGDGVNGVGNVTAELALTKAGEDIFVTGRVEGTVKLQCSRCLAEYGMTLAPAIEAPFFPRAAESPEGEEEDDGDVNFHDGEKLDLFPVLRDHLLLAIPFKPLCMEECKGLCPKCGADLNTAPCGCTPKEPDARFAALQKLKERL
ncbi:MAG: DUF177 domain-containing protein [Nitrospinae bacterium]|nr:DUF177 domain-containing protein [Nitrospinota bacterium]